MRSRCRRYRPNKILEHATNVLSIIYPHIYFPTYSNMRGWKRPGSLISFAAMWQFRTAEMQDLEIIQLAHDVDEFRESFGLFCGVVCSE